MARPYVNPAAYDRQRQKARQEADRRDTERLKDLADRIARQRAKRSKHTAARMQRA